jgi:hypothetical protein
VLILLAFVVRGTVSLGVGAFAYFGDPTPLMRRLAAKKTTVSAPVKTTPERVPGASTPALRALLDMAQARFILGFLLTILLMRFFADLTRTALVNVVLRGIVISYLGFLLMRRLDVRVVGARLDRIFKLNLEESLPAALEMVDGSCRHTRGSDSPSLTRSAVASERRSQGNHDATPLTATLRRKRKD